MGQIYGRRRTIRNDSTVPGGREASLNSTDSVGNQALATIAYGPNNTTYVDDTDAAALGIYYYMDKAPDADPEGAVWRVQRATLVSPGLSKYEWGCKPDMSSCGNYDHLRSAIRNGALIVYN